MSRPDLLVDGRVLDDHHPGVRRFWLPILRAWAERGGRGLLAHQRGIAPDATLLAAGLAPLELAGGPRNPLAIPSTRRAVRASGARATLSPLYLSLSGATRNLATVFDLTGRSHPRSWVSRRLWEAAIWRVQRGASTVIAPSQTAAREIEAALPGLRGRVERVPPVAPPPPRSDVALLAPLELADGFALAVATHRPHKRLAALARAWRDANASAPLVLVGRGSESLAAPPWVRGLGFVADELLEGLLAAAGCLVSASAAEGFGLPVLAALAARVPVVATRLAALEEVGGEAICWCEPDDLPCLVERTTALIENPDRAREQCSLGAERARWFSAERASGELDRLLRG